MRPERVPPRVDGRGPDPDEAGRETVPPRLLTLPEVAAFLSVSPKSVRRLVASRGLPHYRLGRVLRFDAADVSRWLAARKVR